MTMGCSIGYGGGEPPNLPHGSSVKAAGYLRSGQIGPNSHTAIASPILGATVGGLEAPPRPRRHEERWPSQLHPLAVLHRPGDSGEGASVARCPPSLGRERAIAHRARRKTRTEGGGRRVGTDSLRKEESSCRGGRGSDARGRARASFDVVAEVDGQWPAQRSGRTSISPDLEAFRDGRLARRSNVRKYAAAGEKTLAPSS